MVLGFFGVLLLPSIVFAGPIVRTGDSVSVDADQMLESDFYGFGSSVTISGTAKQDAYIAGGTVTVNAPVEGDLTVVGGVVQVHASAPIKDDVRVVGGEVLIAGTVEGDVVVMGGKLTILSTANVKGDVMFVGGEALIEGDVLGSVIGTAEQVRINSHVGGAVSVRATRSLTLGDKADVVGDVTYKSRNDVARAQNAVVTGKVRKEEMPKVSPGSSVQFMVMQVLVALFAALTLFLMLRSSLERLVDRTIAAYGVQGLIGLAILLFTPLVGVLLVTSVLGSIVGVVVILMYAGLLIVTFATVGIVLGGVVERVVLKRQTLSFLGVVFGTIGCGLIAFIPVLGPILLFILFVIVLGGLGASLYRLIR